MLCKNWIVEIIVAVLLGDLSKMLVLCSQTTFQSALTLNNDESVLDGDLDAIRDRELFLGVTVAH